jgi:predicted phage tail protein
VQPGTTYSYRVRAFDTTGTSLFSNTASATTHEPLSPPATPTGLTATAVATTRVNLAWTDNANNEAGFRIERSTNNKSFTQVAEVGANAMSYSDPAVSGGKTYYYRVRAFNAGGNSLYSNTASAKTPRK